MLEDHLMDAPEKLRVESPLEPGDRWVLDEAVCVEPGGSFELRIECSEAGDRRVLINGREARYEPRVGGRRWAV